MSIRDTIDLFFTQRQARQDAQRDVDGGTLRQIVTFGTDPREVAHGTRAYQQAVHDAALTHEVEARWGGHLR